MSYDHCINIAEKIGVTAKQIKKGYLLFSKKGRIQKYVPLFGDLAYHYNSLAKVRFFEDRVARKLFLHSYEYLQLKFKDDYISMVLLE